LGAGGSVASDAASNGTEKRVAGREVTDTATARRVADFEAVESTADSGAVTTVRYRILQLFLLDVLVCR